MIFAGIVAGGTGTRMGADMPKQFLKIGGKPIIIHTISKFLKVNRIEKIYVGVHGDWLEYCSGLIENYGLDKNRLSVISGGADRNSTVFNIIDAIVGDYGENRDDIILTHDAVRPFVTEKVIADNIDKALKYDACGTYIHAVDTIICSKDGNTVNGTPTRKEMFQAQTPQSFNISKLKAAYSAVSDDKKSTLTDTCSIFTSQGLPVNIVEGDTMNMKITTKTDLLIADSLIRHMN